MCFYRNLNKNDIFWADMIPFTYKYAPKSTSEILGQEMAVSQIRSFISDFKKKKKKALLLYGSPGSGKTSSVYATAKEMNLEVLEVNASDFRDEERLNASVGQASKQSPQRLQYEDTSCFSTPSGLMA